MEKQKYLEDGDLRRFNAYTELLSEAQYEFERALVEVQIHQQAVEQLMNKLSEQYELSQGDSIRNDGRIIRAATES